MTKEIQDNIINKYKQYFKYYFDKSSYEPMKYGFTCGDGWADLIDQLLFEIHDYISNNNLEPFQFLQVKEKFGLLRIYVDTKDERVIHLIDTTESLSEKVCEICGTLNNIGKTNVWIRSVCKDCYENTNWPSPRQWYTLEEWEKKSIL